MYFKPLLLAVVLTLSASLTGCAPGFNREGLRAELSAGAPEISVVDTPKEITAADIRVAYKTKPQLNFPFSVAVYVDGVRLKPEDRAIIAEWEATLKKRGVVSSLFPLSEVVLADQSASFPKKDLKSLRLAAAQHGADALLVIRGGIQRDRYVNPLSVFYLTLVGALFVPGSHVASLAMFDGAMIDVRNGYLYASSSSEGEGDAMGPAAYLRYDEADPEAVSKAFKAIGEDLVERVTALK